MKRIIVGLLLLTGCDASLQVEVAPVNVAQPQIEQARFTVTVLAEFPDNLAYGGKRRIYEITDTKTKVTYLSITGMGLDRLQNDRDEAMEQAADAIADAALSSAED